MGVCDRQPPAASGFLICVLFPTRRPLLGRACSRVHDPSRNWWRAVAQTFFQPAAAFAAAAAAASARGTTAPSLSAREETSSPCPRRHGSKTCSGSRRSSGWCCRRSSSASSSPRSPPIPPCASAPRRPRCVRSARAILCENYFVRVVVAVGILLGVVASSAHARVKTCPTGTAA